VDDWAVGPWAAFHVAEATGLRPGRFGELPERPLQDRHQGIGLGGESFGSESAITVRLISSIRRAWRLPAAVAVNATRG
jgi:hypothetical protein